MAMKRRRLAWKPALEFCTGKLAKNIFSELFTASL